MIEAAETVAAMGPIGPIPNNEGQARALAPTASVAGKMGGGSGGAWERRGMPKRPKRGIKHHIPKADMAASQARKEARSKADAERLRKADEPWNKEWVHVWRGGAPQ